MRGSITKRSPGSFTIQGSGGFNDAGKRVRVTRTVHGSRRDAERALTKLLRDIDTGTVALDGRTPLAAYMVDKWLPHIRTRVRPSTYGRYEALVRVQIVPRIGRVKLSGLRPAHVQKVLDEMIAREAAPASVLQCHRVLSAALRQAVRWQVLAVNPSEAVRPPRPERVPLHVPEPAQVRAILEAASGTVHEVPLLLAATTGMRRGEVLGLRWSVVDLDAGLLRVVVTLQKSRGVDAEYVSPKTDRSRRTISLPPSTVARLRQHRKEQTERRLFVGAAWHDTDLVCERGDGEHLDPDGFSNAFSRYAAAAKVPEARLHDLRHAFATTLLTAGVNVKVASEASV
jgi:integrase